MLNDAARESDALSSAAASSGPSLKSMPSGSLTGTVASDDIGISVESRVVAIGKNSLGKLFSE